MSTALPIYLAMTVRELRACSERPEHIAWMACHFSPYTQGLSNIPETLPENALLMVNDRTEPHGHDPATVAQQLNDTVEQFNIRGVVLDFQRPYNDETQRIAAEIQSTLSCPVAVTPAYATAHSGAVFVPPVPPDWHIADHLKPWAGKEIWLEIENQGSCLTVTEDGCAAEALPELPKEPLFSDIALCCHYGIQVQNDRAVFSLYRTEDDQIKLLQKAEDLGVTLAVGLYQEYR